MSTTDTTDGSATGGPAGAPAGGSAGDSTVVPDEVVGRVSWRTVITLAVAVAAGLLLTDLVTVVITRIQGLLIALVVSLFLSFAMEPAVQWLSRRGIRRGLGTLLVFLFALLLVVGFVAAMAPLVVSQIESLITAGPSVLDDLARRAGELPGGVGPGVSDFIERQAETLPDRLPDMAGELGRGALGVGTTLLGLVLQLLTVLLVTFYLTADGPRLRRTLSSRMAPDRQRELLEMWELAIAKTGGYVYSRILTAVISAIFHTVVFSLVGVDFAVALGVWVGIVSSLIPVVGTYLAGALPLVVAVAGEPVDALWVLGAVIAYQQVENYLVAPRITAATMELHPAIAFVSVLLGAAVLGPVGALVALPAAAIVAALASAYGDRHDVLEHGLTEDDPAGGNRQ